MDVAGLVLGAIPILIDGVKTYCELYDEWDRNGKLLVKRSRELSMEQIMLRQTLGPPEDAMDTIMLHSNPEDRETIIGILGDMKDMIHQLRETLNINEEGKPQSSSRVKDQWKKIKRTFKKKETIEMFDKIHRYNDDLRRYFKAKREISSDKALFIPVQQTRHLSKICQQLRRDLGVLHKALNEVRNDTCTNLHPSMINLSWHLQDFKLSSSIDMALPARNSCCENTQSWQGVKVDIERKETSHDGCDTKSTLVTTSRSSVRKVELIDPLNDNKKPSSASPATAKTWSKFPSLSPEQIVTICTMPQEKLFNGYLLHSDVDEEAIIKFEQTPSGRSLDILPWRTLLTNYPDSDPQARFFQKRKMSRKDGLAIAAAATWSVLLLCGTPWLHETRVGAEDITLLRHSATSSSDGSQLTCALPAFQFEFNPSDRPCYDSCGKGTKAQLSMIRHRALFALAIILLEIGLDRDFNDICEALDRPLARLENDDASLLESYKVADEVVDSLYDEMGDRYAEAVKRCLDFNFEGRRDMKTFENESLRQQFFRGVVAPVQERYDQEQTRHRVLQDRNEGRLV